MDIVEQHVRNLPDEELIQMVRVDFDEYTDEAMAYARDEMSKRGIPEYAAAKTEPAEAAEGGDAVGTVLLSDPIGDDTLEAFLREELQYPESCKAILDFVTSLAIRCGEYEAEKIVIRKMDRGNFILCTEEENEETGRAVTGSVTVGKDRLEALIEQVAEENGFTGADDEGEALDELIGEIEKFRK